MKHIVCLTMTYARLRVTLRLIQFFHIRHLWPQPLTIICYKISNTSKKVFVYLVRKAGFVKKYILIKYFVTKKNLNPQKEDHQHQHRTVIKILIYLKLHYSLERNVTDRKCNISIDPMLQNIRCTCFYVVNSILPKTM